jgi:hypothetical protein
MKKKLNIIGAILIGIWVLIMILIQVLDLEFVAFEYEVYYLIFKSYTLPFALILFLIASLSRDENGIRVFIKFSIIILICIISFYTSIFFMFLNMCSYSTGDILYVNKENNKIVIAERSFGCGATDSSPATLSIEKIEPFAFFFIRAVNCDTTKINKEKWERKD